MAKVRIRNTTGKHAALSFGFLFGNGFGRKHIIVDESKIKEADYKMIARLGLVIEDPASPIPEPAPKVELKKDVEEKAPEAKPAEAAKPELRLLPAEDDGENDEKPAKKFSRADLDKMPRPQLKELATSLKIETKQSRGNIIDAIIKLQEKL